MAFYGNAKNYRNVKCKLKEATRKGTTYENYVGYIEINHVLYKVSPSASISVDDKGENCMWVHITKLDKRGSNSYRGL